jgi:hypothetical protein
MRQVDFSYSVCDFGIARGDITPPVGIYHRLWGAATHERSTGVHRPLEVAAMAFRAAGPAAALDQEQILIAVDLCLLWAREMSDLLQALCTRTGLAREQIAVTFSHTHAGGLPGLERVELPGGDLIPAYLEALAERLGGLIEEARRTVQPATLGYGIGRCPMVGQRDFWDEDSGQFVCGFNPNGPADDTVLVARATRHDGGLLATVVNYACHPTTLAWQNTLISPDFPGAMREVIEKATNAPCVFIQGASGDMGPRHGFVGDVAVADHNGRQLGYAALAALEALPPPLTHFRYKGPVVSGATLGTWDYVPLAGTEIERMKRWQCRRWTTDLAYRSDLPTLAETQSELLLWQEREEAAHAAADPAAARDCHAMAERMTRRLTRLQELPPGMFPFPIVLWQMGDAFWLAVEAELYNHFQRALRERFPGVPIMLATLTNGSRCCYLPTAYVYGKGIYQESIAVLAPGCLEELLGEIGNQIQAWMTP